MKVLPIIVKTSHGNILRVDWDVGEPDQTIKTMFVVSIRNPLDLFSKKQTVGCWNGSSWMEVSITGKSFSESLILTSTSPQYDKRLFIESPVQYMKIPSSKHVVYINCFENQNKTKNLGTQHVPSL